MLSARSEQKAATGHEKAGDFLDKAPLFFRQKQE
jgi:hypothetical protein